MKTLISIIVVAVVLVGVYWLLKGDSSPEPTSTPTVTASPTATASVSPSVSPTATPTSSPTSTPVISLKTFTVTGTSFSFNPPTIKVKKGDTVKIIFVNNDGFHDWTIDAFNAHTSQIQAGQTATVTFVADKTGSFEYYCSVGTHRAQGMKGTLVVE